MAPRRENEIIVYGMTKGFPSSFSSHFILRKTLDNLVTIILNQQVVVRSSIVR